MVSGNFKLLKQGKQRWVECLLAVTLKFYSFPLIFYIFMHIFIVLMEYSIFLGLKSKPWR